jgi:hypothetical protein
VPEAHQPLAAVERVLDVDPAVAQRPAVPVGLGDFRGEGDDALEA